jgi:CubicO group peptidase (beta-lactamase class C family)
VVQGIGGDVGGDYEIAGRDETVKKILAQPLRSEPGKVFFYSNAGYTLLAAIIERVSGQNYEEFVRQKLFLPAGMVNTGYRLPNWKDKVIAHWYIGGTDNGVPLDRPYPQWNLVGNGGILSTTDDMFRWNRALKGDSVLSAEVKKKLWTPFLHDYAYGWDVIKTEHGTLIQHDGGSTLGNSFDYRWFVDPDILIALFCNQSPDGSATIFKLSHKIQDLIFGGSIEIPPLLAPGDKRALVRYEGDYELSSSSRLRVRSLVGELLIEPKGQDAMDLLLGTESQKGRNQTVNERTAILLSEIRKENYEALAEAYGGRVPLEQIKKNQTRMRAETEGKFGSYKGFEVLGTMPFEGDALTLVKIRYEKGSQVLEYVWGDKNLQGWGARDSPFEIKFLPKSGEEFVGYDLDLGKIQSVEFRLDEKGSVQELVFREDGSSIEARRARLVKD